METVPAQTRNWKSFKALKMRDLSDNGFQLPLA